MTAAFGADIPIPQPGEITLYLLGPGIGESVIVVMPDNHVLVMDVCVQEQTNLTIELLDRLGVSAPHLLVVSHPDLDHVRGLDELLSKKPPTEMWRYPLEARAREFALAWARKRKRTALTEALRALGDFLRHAPEDTFPAMYGDRSWPHDVSAAYRVHALAPTPYDHDLAMRAWDRRLAHGRPALERWLDDVLNGVKPFGDAPNLISLAIALEHGDRKVLLGGDVLKGTRSAKSGWKGIARLMEKHKRLHLLESLAAVKVAHHGSGGAFEPIVWRHHFHGAAAGEPVAFIAPFKPSGLPKRDTLVTLRPYARALLITDVAKTGASDLVGTGWTTPLPAQVTRLDQTTVPCVAVQIGAAGNTRMAVSAAAIAAV